jgi:hypothetical protein
MTPSRILLNLIVVGALVAAVVGLTRGVGKQKPGDPTDLETSAGSAPAPGDTPGFDPYAKILAGNDQQGAEARALARPYESNEPDPPSPDFPGWPDYEAAKGLIYNGDLEGAIVRLESAVRLTYDFGEGWYQLGAAQANRAVELVNYDEGRALGLLHASIDNKRRARDLLNAGSSRIWTADEKAQALADVEEGLRDADELLANDALALAALRMYAENPGLRNVW